MWEKIRKVKVPPLAKLLVEALNYIWGVKSYTMLVNSDRFTCRNMTIANSSGFGSAVWQAVAVYAEGDGILFEN